VIEMIHHISIAAHHPQHVAQVLAQVWEGQMMPFPAHEGSYIVMPFDAHGTMIEVYPHGAEMTPGKGDEQVQFIFNPAASPYSATHAAISVPVSEAKIRAIAEREGWRVVKCDRQGYFEVMEVWVENQLLIELLPPSFTARYLAFMQPESLRQFASAAVSA
jgi:hypothetical protein